MSRIANGLQSASQSWVGRCVGRIASPGVMLVTMVLAGTILGLTDFNHFGEAWDQESSFHYADDVVAHFFDSSQYWEEYGVLKHYGPAYLLVARNLSAYVHALRPGWTLADVRHFINHMTFELAIVSMYFLCRRYVRPWISLVGTALFATQPVFFGHSFINEKDVPFLAIFLLAVVVGLSAADRIEGSPLREYPSARRTWGLASGRDRGLFVVLVLASLVMVIELLAVRGLVLPTLQATVADAYRGQSPAFINEWFAETAENASRLPVDVYVQKATALYMRYRWPLSAVALAPALIMAMRIFGQRVRTPERKDVGGFLVMLLGGVLVGLAAGIRVIGLWAGPLVGTVLVGRRRVKSASALLIFGAACAAVCMVAWPYLRLAPLKHLIESIMIMGRFPWSGGILFEGQVLSPEALPWYYLPKMMAIQFTLPLVVLAPVGLSAAASRVMKRAIHVSEMLMLCAWFVVPILAVIVLRSTVYGNFRQFLFVTPPLFVLAVMGADAILTRFRSRLASGVLVAIILIPGVAGIIRLHPYEYVYYNALVGGVRGAFRSYEMDYWCTSYRQAMEEVNRIAPEAAEIAVATPVQAAAHYARTDLAIFEAETPLDLSGQMPAYGIGCGRGDNDLGFFPEQEIAWTVSVEGAVLSVVRDLRGLN